ncbi:MAG: hypothetical protein RJA44_2440 [Pseudomonadota bacterium]
MNKTFLASLLGALTLASLPLQAQAQAAALPALGADLSQTSVSGISSGGFMTAQLHTAFSGSFVGAGIIAAGPYYCAGSVPSVKFMQNAMTTCMVPLGAANAPNAAFVYKKAQQFAQEGKIDDVANLARQKVYIFSGSSDGVVKTSVVNQTEKYYQLAGVPAAQIKYVKNINAGHSIVTDTAGDVSCSATEPPFINNCGFEQSHDILRHIYGNLQAPASSDNLSGRILKFNQAEFIQGSRSSMSQTAYAYVPKACETEACKVHIAIHGCLQGAKQLGDRYYSGTGYNEMADTNRMIVLYPQAEITPAINPQGCWDFWGYSDADTRNPQFHTRNAPQMSAIMAMVRRLGEARR